MLIASAAAHLSLNLLKHLADFIITVDFADTFATSTPRGLQHDGVADALAALNGLLQAENTRFVVSILWYVAMTLCKADCDA